jgi:uncharacterized protein (DUF2147 family)
MKRLDRLLGCLAVLMMLSSSAHAGAISFMVHGHRVRVERPRHCFAVSCLSVTVPGRHGPAGVDRVDDVAAASDVAPTKPASASTSSPPLPSPAAASNSSAPAPAAAPVQAKPVAAPLITAATSANKQAAETASAVPPSPGAEPSRPAIAETKSSNVEKLPVNKPPAGKPLAVAQAAAIAASSVTVSKQTANESADTPLGDWQSEANKGLVRIEPCGNALCGYVVDAATDAKGEMILINMKPKGASEWTGTIVGRGSGDTYYAKMAMKQPSTLRVEACAAGRFFCSGNDWSRIVTKPQALITSRQIAGEPPS